jgi:hypothetical protein
MDTRFTGFDRKQLGQNHKVADGGIVDNTAISFACAREGPDSKSVFLISDAGKIFDDLDPEEEDVATVNSPIRTFDYLITQTAKYRLDQLRPQHRIGVIRLTDARQLEPSETHGMTAG